MISVLECIGSDVRDKFLDMLFQIRNIWTVGNLMNNSALQSQKYSRSRMSFELVIVKTCDFFLINENNIDSFFKLIDDNERKTFVCGHQSLTWSAPRGMNINDN